MSKTPNIPNAKRVHVVKGWPETTLHIESDLPYFPGTPGYDGRKRDEMMRAAAMLCGPRCEYDAYEIHAPDKR